MKGTVRTVPFSLRELALLLVPKSVGQPPEACLTASLPAACRISPKMTRMCLEHVLPPWPGPINFEQEEAACARASGSASSQNLLVFPEIRARRVPTQSLQFHPLSPWSLTSGRPLIILPLPLISSYQEIASEKAETAIRNASVFLRRASWPFQLFCLRLIAPQLDTCGDRNDHDL